MANECCSCGEMFGSVSAFDAHRVGTHEYTYSQGAKFDPPVEDGRRCLWVWEIEGSPRFTKNARGTWSLSNSLAAAHTLNR